MLRFRPEARVGLVIFIGALTLLVVYWFLKGWSFRGRTYAMYAVFRNVQRLSDGADVRMAGVMIGQVTGISLWQANRARVEMRISEDVKVPANSVFRTTSGGLVGDIFVEVIPPEKVGGYVKHGQTVYGEEMPTLDTVLPEVTKLVLQLQTSAAAINDVLADKKMLAAFRNSMANTELTTRRAAELMLEFQNIAMAKSEGMDSVLGNATKASADFAALAKDLRVAVEKGGTTKVNEILESSKRAAANLEQASAKLRDLAADPKLNTDVRETVSTLRQTAENAKALTDRLNKAVGGRRPGQLIKGFKGTSSQADVFARFGGKLRLDYNVTIPGGTDRFYKLGLFDVGESTKVNMQMGRMLSPTVAVRYGIYGSRLGMGMDKSINNHVSLHADLFRPSDPMLEVKGLYDFSKDLGVWVGGEDILHSGPFMLGLQYRK